MNIEVLDSWAHFKKRLARYLSYPQAVRDQMLFRGHASSQWELLPTLDRMPEFRAASDEQRNTIRDALIQEFKMACWGLQDDHKQPVDNLEWEFLGRHHGLPTTILDWTASPYVAAYFAFCESPPQDAVHASIWVLEASGIEWGQVPEITMIDLERAARLNLRAVEQEGRGMRVESIENPASKILNRCLRRLDIPIAERRNALVDLNEMRINARSMFRDIDGAARTAMMRIGVERDGA